MRLKQSVEGKRIVIEPLGDLGTVFGVLKPRRKFRSIAEEAEGMERPVGEDVAGGE
jgi:hypothetical protein